MRQITTVAGLALLLCVRSTSLRSEIPDNTSQLLVAAKEICTTAIAKYANTTGGEISFDQGKYKVLRSQSNLTILQAGKPIVNLQDVDFGNYTDCILRITAALSNQNAIFRNPGQLLGGPNSVIRNPGQIFGGDNSIFKSRGEILTSLLDRGSDDIIRTSRTFVGPHGVPPKDFAAYGIVAFPQKSTPDSYKRYEIVCQAYIATLPEAATLSAPLGTQMVTVWPVDNDSLLGQLSRPGNSACKLAIDRYDLPTSLSSLKDARTQENISLSGNGPYLLAWSPATQKGKKDAIVLILDLSFAFTPTHFDDAFRAWRGRIEQNHDVWRRGWIIDDLRTEVRYWADKWGTTILSFGHAKE